MIIGRAPLKKLKLRMQEILSGVPEEAHAFHLASDEVLREVNILLSKRIPLFYEASVKGLESSAERLLSMKGGLITLIRSTGELFTAVSQLRDKADNNEDRDVSSHVSKKCDEWKKAIDLLGRDVDGDQLLLLESESLSRFKTWVKDYTTAAALLAEANKYVRDLSPMDTAELQAALHGLKEDFFAHGPDDRWLSELSRLLEMPRKISRQPPPPPPKPPDKLRDIVRLYEDAREWARVLSRQLSRNLEDAYRLARGEPGQQADLDRLHRDIFAEREALHSIAQKERDVKLSALREDARNYGAACGYNAELGKRLQGLESNLANTPNNYLELVSSCEQGDQFLAGIAHAKEKELAAHLGGCVQRLEERVTRLGGFDLTDNVRCEVVSLVERTGKLNNPIGQRTIREYLRLASLIEKEVEVLERRASEDLAAYARLKSSLLERIADLERAVTAFGMQENATFGRGLSNEVSQQESQGNLDDMLDRLEEIGRIVGEAENEFIAGCAPTLEEHFNFCREAHVALSVACASLGKGHQQGRFSSDKPQPRYPKDATNAYDEWTKRRAHYAEQLRELRPELEKAAKGAQGHFHQLIQTPGYFSPPQRHQAEEIMKSLDEFAAPAGLPDLDSLPGFTSLANVMNRYQTFIGPIEGEREEIDELHKTLIGRLRNFSEEDLEKRFEEAADRISALVYGINVHAQPSADVKRQLELADGLLTRVEICVRRQAAEELDNACAAADTYLRTAANPIRQELQSAVNHVNEFAPGELAPAPVRRRLLQYTDRLGKGVAPRG